MLWAADHAPRELSVGRSTAVALVANRVAPGLLDRYLARAGYDSQQLAEPVDPDRPDNLFEPRPGDHGAHGRFDDRALDHSWQLAARLAVGDTWRRLTHARARRAA